MHTKGSSRLLFLQSIRSSVRHVGLAVLLAVPLGSGSAHAALIAEDTFESYAVGQVETAANVRLNGGSGFTAAYDVADTLRTSVVIVDRSANPLAYSNGAVTVSGGSRALAINGANDTRILSRALPTLTAPDPVYFGFLIRTNNVNSSNQDFYQLGLDNTSDAVLDPNAGIGVNNNTSNQRFFARGNATSGFDPGTVAANTTYLLVGKVTRTAGTNYNLTELFLNPDSLTEPSAPSASAPADQLLSSFNVMTLKTLNLDAGDAYEIDNLRFATSYIDLVTTMPVPEPTFALWLPLFAAAAARRGRSRRAIR